MKNISHIWVATLTAALIFGCGKNRPTPNKNNGLHLIPATAEQVRNAIRSTDGEVVLVNAWATWCQPCVEEFPDMMKLYRTYKARGLRLVLISADFPDQGDQALAFLKKQGVDFTTYHKSGKDMAFINTLDKRWGGALPATWVYDGNGNVRHFWEGKATYEKFEQAVLDVIDQ